MVRLRTQSTLVEASPFSIAQAQQQQEQHAAEAAAAQLGAGGEVGPVTHESYYRGDEQLRARVTIVRSEAEARAAVRALYAAPPGTVHACDTEVMDIDVKTQSPVGNGRVTCVSVFSGPNVDYGDGPGKAL